MTLCKKKLSLALILSLSSLHAVENLGSIEIVHIATKNAKSIDGVAASVEIITQKQIEAMGAENLKEIIERTPGITVQYGTFPSASAKSKSSISIRGMGANGTLFLLDGRRLAGEVANPYDLDRIPASIIERIEIVKGPMSSLYGSDAVGGVINIITKRPSDKDEVNIATRYGSNQEGEAENFNINMSYQGRSGKLGSSIYMNFTSTSPYYQDEDADVYLPLGCTAPACKVKPSKHPVTENTPLQDYYNDVGVSYREESKIVTLGGRFTYDFTDALVVGLDINYLDESREGSYIGYFHPTGYKAMGNKLPAYNVPVLSEDTNMRFDTSLDLEYRASDSLHVKARVYRSYYEKRNKTMAAEYKDMGFSSLDDSAHNGMNANVDLKVAELSASWLPHDEHFTSFGIEYRDEIRESSVFDKTSGMSEKAVDYQSAYIQDEWDATEALYLIAGARYDAISNAENKPTFRLGGVYSFNSLARLRANFAQGYRTPDIREMYIFKQTPNGFQLGADPAGYDLKPESTNAFEIGLTGRDSKFHYDVALFYNQISDTITQFLKTVTLGGEKVQAYTFENVSNAHTQGLELSLGYDFLENLYGGIFWTELQTEDEETAKELPFNPERTISLSAQYALTSALSLDAVARYIGKQHYQKLIDQGTPSETRSDSVTNEHTLVDMTLRYELNKRVGFYGGVNNILEESVDDIMGSNVGRYYFIGAQAKF
ncbi:MAG: TonB-dependent receptor [Campylobacterota bacterium]|nr:TonB-dependent receptor [Campylobacterota bacterium]